MRTNNWRFLHVALGIAIGVSSGARAADFVVPRFILTGGSYYSFDLVLNLAYTGTSNATVSLTMLNAAGQPILSATAQPVCNPCVLLLDGGQRQRRVSLSQLVLDAGGFSGFVLGLATLSTGGDVANLSVHGTSFMIYSGPDDFQAHDQPLIAVGPGLGSAPIGLFDHLPEREGSITTTPYTSDSSIEIAYVGDTSVDVDLYLRTPPLGAPLRSALGDDVCYPCSYHLDTANRLRLVSINSAIESAGGFSSPDLEIWGEIAASGDVDSAAIDAAIVSSFSSPFELGFERYLPVAVQSRAPDVAVFFDGFEHGDLSRWNLASP
jgi:hypothetical protein